ncbi:MAG: c-type cytochrome [Pyrinomonadaceae bacterium]
MMLLMLATACAQQMSRQPKYKPLEPSAFFENNTSARPVVPGTVARNVDKENAPTIVKNGDAYTNAFPFPLTRELLERGRERYEINCAVCHGLVGAGDGMIVQRGFSPPPSFHRDDVRAQPVGFYFDVITNGYGAMGRYGYQITARDRWAIIAYIRALQLSQHATLDDAPPEQRLKLSEGSNER